jgi:hypothetical protein
MSNIAIGEAQAWCERTKLDLGRNLDGELEANISSQILARVAMTYDVSSWITSDTTPKLIRSIIAMYYAAHEYYRRYANDNDDTNAYADKLTAMADAALANILDGTTIIPGILPTGDSSAPSFYPTDVSSAQCATEDDPSLGPAKFSMGHVF